MKKILITGNMGYVGPMVVRHLRQTHPDSRLIGFDIGFFAKNITNTGFLPEVYLDQQYFGDMRNFPEYILNDIDSIVHLAAISNDPIGNKYEEVTLDINYKSSIALAKKAKEAKVKSFVFASSCSMYGAASDAPRDESSPLNPLTAYAKSKVFTENDLRPLADDEFKITCLRFATACGMSDRLRLDLVLNDFVACAMTSSKIEILSDGTPWRPLINVKDMARAIEWAIFNRNEMNDSFLAVNAGSSDWNYQVKDFADRVAKHLPDISVEINPDAAPDKRSYQVNFDKFKQLAPGFVPKYNLDDTIDELIDGLKLINFADKNFRSSQFMRINSLESLIAYGLLNRELRLTNK